MNGKKILITGASGLVGSALALKLCEHNEVYGLARFSDPVMRKRLEAAGVTALKKDVLTDRLDDVPDDFDYVFSQVVVIPATYANSEICDNYAHKAFDINTYFVGRLMSHCKKAEGIVLASSGSVYTPGPSLVDENGTIGPVDTYGVSKLGGEVLGTFLSRQWEIPTCILRYFFPYDNSGGRPTQWAQQLMRSEPILVNKDYDPLYSPIYMSDCIRYTIEAVSQCDVPAKIINVGGTETVTQKDIIDFLSSELSVKPVFQEVADIPRFWNVDVSLMLSLFGSPKITLREGLTQIAKMVQISNVNDFK